MARNNARMFSTNAPQSTPEPEQQPPIETSRLKATPAAGFKIPKQKAGEELIGQRVYGDTDIFSAPKNFNFEMRR